MRLSIIAGSIIDDAKVAKRVRDKISVTSMLMVHQYLRSFFLGVTFFFISFSNKRAKDPADPHERGIPSRIQLTMPSV